MINTLRRRTALAYALAAVMPSTAHAAGSLLEALSYGTVSAQFRYRFEYVDQDTFTKEAKASTLRTQLGYLTDNYYGVSGFLQFENVSIIGSTLYNDTNNGETEFPVVADPTGTEVNQAHLIYEAGYGSTLKFGRQGINLDNQRFIGTVGWRQNEQTYDAFSLVNTSLPDTTATLVHVTNVNRIFGESHPNFLFRNSAIDGELINLAYKGWSFGSLVGYGYLFDFEHTPLLSHKDVGARFDGQAPIARGVKLLYTAELAKQSDYKDGAATVDADYRTASLGVDIKGVQIKLNYELLSGDGVYGFATPFATLHAFNGWADKFLNTPADGIKDRFVSVAYTFSGFNLLARYHDFGSDNLSYDYGDEVNLQISKKLNKALTLLVKHATYQGDENATVVKRNKALSQDLDKTWLQAELAF